MTFWKSFSRFVTASITVSIFDSWSGFAMIFRAWSWRAVSADAARSRTRSSMKSGVIFPFSATFAISLRRFRFSAARWSVTSRPTVSSIILPVSRAYCSTSLFVSFFPTTSSIRGLATDTPSSTDFFAPSETSSLVCLTFSPEGVTPSLYDDNSLGASLGTPPGVFPSGIRNCDSVFWIDGVGAGSPFLKVSSRPFSSLTGGSSFGNRFFGARRSTATASWAGFDVASFLIEFTVSSIAGAALSTPFAITSIPS